VAECFVCLEIMANNGLINMNMYRIRISVFNEVTAIQDTLF
jgi:hypothetical protein